MSEQEVLDLIAKALNFSDNEGFNAPVPTGDYGGDLIVSWRGKHYLVTAEEMA